MKKKIIYLLVIYLFIPIYESLFHYPRIDYIASYMNTFLLYPILMILYIYLTRENIKKYVPFVLGILYIIPLIILNNYSQIIFIPIYIVINYYVLFATFYNTKKIYKYLTNIFTFIFGLIVIFLLTNKSYFWKNYKKIYVPLLSFHTDDCCMTTSNFYSLRTKNDLENDINKYYDDLVSCYNETIFYDKKADVSISKYEVVDKFFYRAIHIIYDKGNVCHDEYILDDETIDEIRKNGKILSSYYYLNGDEYVINIPIAEILKKFSGKEYIDRNITNDSEELYFVYYYELYEKQYVLEIFTKDNKLIYKVIDQNDHSKYAVYNKEDALEYLESFIYGLDI